MAGQTLRPVIQDYHKVQLNNDFTVPRETSVGDHGRESTLQPGMPERPTHEFFDAVSATVYLMRYLATSGLTPAALHFSQM